MTRSSGSTPLPRATGVQLHPTSLPGGRLGEEAFAFVDWLAEAGQSWWQMLPLGPVGEGGSPYKAPSAFAGSATLLAEPDAPVSAAELDALREREAYWLPDWEAFAGDGAGEDQVRFDREWSALRSYAAERGVRIIGDLPIYVAEDGADHRAHPELFQTGVQAGVPPDQFTDAGQLWGNPLYDWPALRRRRYRWWVERLRRTSQLVDLSRIDHFRGFVAYWSVPARRRRRARRPLETRPRAGRSSTRSAAELGDVPLIAENLGEITEPVERLRRELSLPGMAVMQFAFDPEPAAQPLQTRAPRGGRRRLHRHPRPRHRPRLDRDPERRLPRGVRERGRPGRRSRSPSRGGPWSASPCPPAAAPAWSRCKTSSASAARRG